jgi:hypothetical protein
MKDIGSGKEGDEDICTILPLITEDDDAKIQDTNEIRIGTITRARAKLLNQQVNSFLVGSGILPNENFILPKSLHLCLIRFEEGYGVEGEEARLQSEQEGAMAENNTFSLTQRTSASGGAGGMRQGEVEDQEVGTSTGASHG